VASITGRVTSWKTVESQVRIHLPIEVRQCRALSPAWTPYLEHPDPWPGFHTWYITNLATQLNTQLPRTYVANINERLYVLHGESHVYPDVSVLHRAGQGGRYEVWITRLRHRLPRIAVPLAGVDPDLTVDLQELIERGYDQAAYERRIDYSREPAPPLGPADAEWADALLRAAGLRPEAR
jgi:hypothetical protein